MFMTSSPIWFYSRPYTPNITNNIRHLNHNDSSGKFHYRVALPDEGQVETYHVCKNEEAMLKGRTKVEGNGDVRTLKRNLTPIMVTFLYIGNSCVPEYSLYNQESREKSFFVTSL